MVIHLYRLLDEPGEGNGNLLQYSCLENPMGGGTWWAAVHGVAEGRTRLSDFTFTFHFHALEKEMATHSSVLAWESQGWGSLAGCRLWGPTELETTEATWRQQQHQSVLGLSRWQRDKEPACQCRSSRDAGLILPWVRKIPWSRKWQPTPVFLPGKYHGQRRLKGYSPGGHKRVAQLSN